MGLVLSDCHYPASLRFGDSSTSKLQFTLFLKLGSHYIPFFSMAIRSQMPKNAAAQNPSIPMNDTP